ncbi:MAG: sodium-dependent transporter [Actinomycetaceae bacterium]|nr:sodium-dependent transporter [Actinomycetaceae bacterium]
MAQNTQAAPKRDSWSGQTAFLFAAIGSAVGLGNIWRFPGVAYKNGGGAFIVPYLVSLILIGLVVLLLDYSVGHKFRGSPPLAIRRLAGKFGESVGWIQTATSIVIAVYYAVILAWAIRYIGFSVTQPWTADPEAGTAGFFVGEFLHLGEASGEFDPTPVVGILIPLVFIWIFTLLIMSLGVSGGVEKANKIFMPLLIVLFLIIVVRALFLPGAVEGLNTFFTPDWSAVANPQVWIAAIGQIFFSLSIGFGIMVTYASYLKPKANLTGTGLVAGFANSSFEILAGIGVFATLGYMSVQQGVEIGEMRFQGVMLAFATYPELISTMPGGALFGILFFTSLVAAGITSLISITQVVSSSLQDKFGLSAPKASLVMGIPMALVSIILFAPRSGLTALDIVDDYANNFGVVGGALLLALVAVFSATKLGGLRRHLNTVSAIKTPMVWSWLAGIIVPIVLIYLLISTAISRFQEPYGGGDYSWAANNAYGWGTVAFIIIFSVIFTFLPWRTHVPGAADMDPERYERRGSPMRDLDDSDSIATDIRQAIDDFKAGNTGGREPAETVEGGAQ